MTFNRALIIVAGIASAIGIACLAVACGPESDRGGARSTRGGPEDDDQAVVASPTKVPEELELLNDIRGQIGSPLESSIFQSTVQEATAFDTVYAKTAETESIPAALPSHSAHPRAVEQCVAPWQQYSTSLRNAARTLELGAADLEDAGQYQQADALRAWATKLRAEGRSAGAESR